MSPKARRWQDVDKTEIPVTKLIKSFLMYQEDRNHSPQTVKWYEGMLGRFSRFLGEEAKTGGLDLEVISASSVASNTARSRCTRTAGL